VAIFAPLASKGPVRDIMLKFETCLTSHVFDDKFSSWDFGTVCGGDCDYLRKFAEMDIATKISQAQRSVQQAAARGTLGESPFHLVSNATVN
jgi:hypothetical protein